MYIDVEVHINYLAVLVFLCCSAVRCLSAVWYILHRVAIKTKMLTCDMLGARVYIVKCKHPMYSITLTSIINNIGTINAQIAPFSSDNQHLHAYKCTYVCTLG